MVEASEYNENTSTKGTKNNRAVTQCASPCSIHVLEGCATASIFLILFYFIIYLVPTLSGSCFFTPHFTDTD